MSKIVLELGGKYTAGQVFSQAQSDVKKFGQTNRDALKAGTDSLKELEKGFGEDLGKSVGAAKGVIQGLAQGGIWGALGAAAGAAIGFVIDKFKEASENAKALANVCGEYVTNAVKMIGDSFQRTKTDIEAAKAEVQDFAQIAQGSITASANAKIHQLHIETLQKITDNMSASAIKVLQADEALAAAKIKQEEQHQLATSRAETQEQRIASANETLIAAKNKLAQIENEQTNLSNEENKAILKYAVLKSEQESITQRYKEGIITEEQAALQNAKVNSELNELLEKHKGTIDANRIAVEAAKKASDDVAAAQRLLEHEERTMTLVTQQNEEATRNAERAVLDATQAKKAAMAADTKYAEQVNKKTEEEAERLEKQRQIEEDKQKHEMEEIRLQILKEDFAKQDIEITKECYRLKVNEAQYLALYHRLRMEGLSKEEAMQKLQEAYNNTKANEQKITKVCAKYKLDEAAYIKKFNEMTAKGISETDAYAQLQRDLNDELKARTAAEKKATEETKKKSGGKNENDVAMTVSLNSGDIADIGAKTEGTFSFKEWQKKMRAEQRKGRDAKNNTKIDQAKMTRALKGQMPKAEAEAWMDYAKKKYTPDQMRELGQLAMNKELLSKKEQQRQLKAVEQMAQEIAKSLTIK